MRAAALAVVLFAALAHAQEAEAPLASDAAVAASALDAGVALLPAIEPAAPAQPAVIQRRYNLLLPILEAEALHFTLAAANNLLSREAFAQISWDSIVSHFDGRRPWEFDVDSFVINQFGHPYQGSLAYTAARSSGLSFWWACIYPFMASLTWELFFEVDAPSFNDQITTPLGGVYLGEVLHRTSLLVLRNAQAPKWLRVLGAFLLEPVGQLNRWMLDERLDAEDVQDFPPTFATIGGGVAVGSAFRDPNTLEIVSSLAPQGNVNGRLTYGMPGDPSFHYSTPFSHFDIDFNVTFPGPTVSSFFIRGLLAGKQFGAGKTRGLWGLFGQYDFAEAPLLRVSAVGFGLGTSFQTVLPANFTFQLAGVLSAVPLSSAGTLGLQEGVVRDYHTGPGGQALLEARLIWNDRAWLRLAARTWFIAGLYIDAPGWESISYVTVGPLVRLWGPVAVGGDVVMGLRRAKFDDDLFDRSVTGATVRVTLNWISGESLGAVGR